MLKVEFAQNTKHKTYLYVR